MMNKALLPILVFTFCFTFLAHQSAIGQDTIYRADLINIYNGSTYNTTSGTASIIKIADSFKLYLHEDFHTAQAPDVHIFLSDSLAPSDAVGAEFIDFYTFPDDTIDGAYTFDISEELVNRLDTLNTITFECVFFGNILFGGGEWLEFNADSSGNVDTTTTSVESQELDRALKVFPVPAHDVLNFSLDNNISLSEVSIIDISGKTVYRSSKRESTIDLRQLSAGTYIAYFRSTAGGMANRKFVISR